MELDEKVIDGAGGLGMLSGLDFTERSKEEFLQNLCFTIGCSTQKAQEFVVMHGHSCLSGLVIKGGRGGGHKEEEEEEYKYESVGGCRL